MKNMKAPLLAGAALLLSLCAATACAPFGLFRSQPRDNGGIFLLVAVKSDSNNSAQAVEQTMKVIEGRCDRLGIYCKAERQGGDAANQFTLRVSGAKDTERAKDVLLAEGMELRPVASLLYPAPIKTYGTRAEAESAAGASNDVLPYVGDGKGGSFLVVEHVPVVTGNDVRSAAPLDISLPEQHAPEYEITFSLRPEGAARFGAWTGANIGHYIAVVLNGQVRTAPFIRGQINDSGVINGRFTKQQAEDTALVLMSGNLPAPVELIQEGTYKP
jgi:preprotein translocase subunit SecD